LKGKKLGYGTLIKWGDLESAVEELELDTLEDPSVEFGIFE
jgi:hypothetical protein